MGRLYILIKRHYEAKMKKNKRKEKGRYGMKTKRTVKERNVERNTEVRGKNVEWKIISELIQRAYSLETHQI